MTSLFPANSKVSMSAMLLLRMYEIKVNGFMSSPTTQIFVQINQLFRNLEWGKNTRTEYFDLIK